ncbi:secretion protein HlyD [Saccharobesus litoralis]|uniref:Secretion protein HlyD n=1 Tax=Saccharobesus litoralis TaxID=2172099 RepID=A0A2S0VQU1_9ALTE|nr:PQQ-dependent sugar dehydrogenase [Saccharobesus litoralis]AWB66585.1 secretion protein HlyD [Saccharobesus litoralis]
MVKPYLKAYCLLLSLLPLVCSAVGFGVGEGQIQKTYEKHCASCHGKNLQGGLGSNLVDDTWKFGGTDQDLINIIKQGKTDAGMPAWKITLSDKEIRAMVVFIREQKFLQQQRPATTTALDETVFNSLHHDFSLQRIAEFDSTVWSLSFLPNGGWVATEKAGKIWLKQPNKDKQLITNTPKARVKGQGGYLDIVPDPQYAKNGWLYFTYSQASQDDDSQAMTTLVRGQINNGQWVNQQTLFKANEQFYTGKGVHFGSRIVLDSKYVYFSIGDRGNMQQAQELSQPNGKIHRLHHDGSIPHDNPFVKNKNALPSIWSYGHRNPQGLVAHPTTQQLWAGEHGPRGGDEINLVQKGLNYGWPTITHGINYNGKPISDKTTLAGMEQPKHYWVPSIAPGGMAFYQGKHFTKWRNNLFVGGMATRSLHRLTLQDNKVVAEEVVMKIEQRIRDVAVSPSGELYLVINGSSPKGKIFKVVKKS